MKTGGKLPLESLRVTRRGSDSVELLYSEVVAEEKLKHGTKYERLAAIVFKELRQSDVVRHDIRLRGDGRRTRHQIDVRLTAPTGRRLRAIVECRHLFGKKGTKKLGLPAIRDFASVQRDLQADEAWILTTVGFTGPAETYAEEQGIRLATLSAPARGPQQIDFRGEVGAPSDLRVTRWLAVDDAERERVAPLLAAQDVVEGWIDVHTTYFVDEDGRPRELFHDVIDPIYQRLQRDLKRGTNVGQELFDRPRRVVLGEVPVAVRGFDWEIDLTYGRFDFSIDLADKLVRLLLESLDGRVKESFTLPQLRRWAIGPEDRLVREANDG